MINPNPQTQPNLEPQTNAIETVTLTPLTQINPITLFEYGGIATAVILAIALLILALAEYNKVFFPPRR
ncbi:MAG: hypothetical protein RIG63_04085 [Coleofasciculus chthonoplastes F3-SA18-01]|uniref:hypothetical protein n=1 Tax=Coleofasciculus chthonoplastes TaxID=64178 RepID=UPI0032FF14FD